MSHLKDTSSEKWELSVAFQVKMLQADLDGDNQAEHCVRRGHMKYITRVFLTGDNCKKENVLMHKISCITEILISMWNSAGGP